MAEVAPQVGEIATTMNKRKSGHNKGGKARKKQKKQFPAGMMGERAKKIDPKLKKFLRKKARDYDSGSDDEEAEVEEKKKDATAVVVDDDAAEQVSGDGDGLNDVVDEEEASDKDDVYDVGAILPGITKLNEGCRAFSVAFKSIIKKNVSENPLGPVLSEQKKLVAEKLAEENAERKSKGDAKKEKKLVAEKGHKEPAEYLNTHEKFLISVATKGVVKLFNAVNKAQVAQKGLNPLRSKDAKVINRRRKQAFLSEIHKPSSTNSKVNTSEGNEEGEAPSWAPLRDNYMLTNPSLKDWDKNPESASMGGGSGKMSDDSSSDED